MTKATVQDAWNPQQYEKFKDQRSQPFFDLMALLQPVKSASAIDLGCGTGELTLQLHKHLLSSETVGIDSSVEMLRKAQAINDGETSGLRFEQKNIESWSAPTSVDVIFSNAALQWCAHHNELFVNLKNNLRPGGQIAIQMPMNHDYPTHLIAHEMSREEPWASLLKQPYQQQSELLKSEQYAEMLFKLGFQEQNIFFKVYGHSLGSREDVIEWVKGSLLTHFKSQLAATDYDQFLREYRKRVFAVLADEKPFFYTFKRLFIWAKL